MAKISRPGALGTQSSASIGIGTSSQAGAGAGAIGSVLSAAGQGMRNSNQLSLASQVSGLVDAEGDKLFEASKKAHQTATILNKTTEATEAFIKSRDERYRQTVDKDGNPTFDTLHADVGKAGNDILEATAGKIIDPEAAAAFRAQFGNYVANQKVSALQVGLNRQVEFGRSSLNKGLETLINQAGSDESSQLGGYEAQGVSALEESLKGGLISQDEFDLQRAAFSETIRTNKIGNLIRSRSPEAALILGKTPEEVGISNEAYDKLTKTHNAAIKTDEIVRAKAEKQRHIDNFAEEVALAEAVESQIDSGAMRADELLALEGKLTDTVLKGLHKKLILQEIKEAKQQERNLEIGTRIAEGEDLTDLTTGQVNDFYDTVIGMHESKFGEKANFESKAQLAAAIPRAVPKLAKQLEYGAKFGDGRNAQDLLAAYTYIKDRKKVTLDSGFDTEAVAIMEYTERLVDRAGISPQEAMIQARDVVMSEPNELLKTEFAAEKDFKNSELRKTATADLNLDGFFGDTPIEADVATTYKEFVRDGFMATGDMDTARGYAQTLMARKHGTSEVSGETKYMFNPPEKAFPNISPAALRESLVEDVTGRLPEGVDANTVSLHSDDLTKGPVQAVTLVDGSKVTRDIPTWVVTYKKEIDGNLVELPLLNPNTGQPVRWTAVGTDFAGKAKVKAEAENAIKLEEAKKAREEKFKNPNMIRANDFGFTGDRE